MSPTIYMIILFIAACTVHELAHYIAFKAYGQKPKIKLRWFGMSMGGLENYSMKVKDYKIVLTAGIYAGMPIAIYNNQVFIFYMLACSFDVIMLYVVNGRNMTFKQSRIISLEKDLKEIKALPN